MPRCYSLSCGRGYSLSCRGVIVRAVLLYHAAGLIAYQVAGLLSIIPRCYSAGGSALSFRVVLLYHAAGCCYSQSCRRVYIIIQRCYSISCGRSYSAGGSALSCRGVIVYHAAWFCFIMPRGVAIPNHACAAIIFV